MTIYAHIVGASHERLWGLTPVQRLQRALGRLARVRLVSEPAQIPADAEILLLRGDYVYDGRVLQGLVDNGDVVLRDGGGTPVAVRARGKRIADLIEAFRRTGGDEAFAGLRAGSLAEIASGLQTRLRKLDPPWAWQVRADNRRDLEKALFGGAYKGVTDLVTKWLWPLPARWATRLCVRLGLRPNHVTSLSLVLACLAIWLFLRGDYGWGLLAGWIMTFLDTVDGKLARVTLTASRFGDVLDHGIDLVHPPLWYIAWGLGLAAWTFAPPLNVVLWAIVLGYVGGRVCEGAFKFVGGRFSLFIWRPLDSYNRLVTARRNPNLILLTLAWLAGRPDLGLAAVAIWTLASTAVLAARVAWAARVRRREGALCSWLEEVETHRRRKPLAVRLFTHAPPSVDEPGRAG